MAQRAAAAAETRRRLLDAGGRLLSTEDYETVETSRIAAEAGVSRTQIHHLFGSKAGLLLALVQENNAGQFEAGKAAAAKARSALGKIDRTLAAWAEMDLRHPKLLAALQAISWTWDNEAEATNRADLRPFLDQLADFVRLGQERGEIRAMPVETAVEIVWHLYTMGLRAGVFDGLTPAEATAAIATRVRSALAA
jgi:AcrR family transcriptional regulator